MIVVMYDAENGVTKEVRNIVKVSVYNDEVRCTDNTDVTFFIPEDEIKHYAFCILDNEERSAHD